MSVAIMYRFRAREGKAAELLTLLQQARDFSLTGWLERVEAIMTEPLKPLHESRFVRR